MEFSKYQLIVTIAVVLFLLLLLNEISRNIKSAKAKSAVFEPGKKPVMPATKTPAGVYLCLLLLLVALILITYIFLGSWGIVISLIVLGSTTTTYTQETQGYHALILLNEFTGKQRVVFQGMSLSLPWESTTHLIDLRVEIKKSLTQTYASKDVLMIVEFLFTIRVNIEENPEQNILLYSYYEVDAIENFGAGMFSQMISDYYGKKPGEELRNKYAISKAIFEDPKVIEQKEKFEQKNGTKAEALLIDSDYHKDTQKFRDTISSAKSFRAAVKELTDGGMNKDHAEQIVKLMNMDNVNETMYKVNVTGLEKLEHASLVGPPSSHKQKEKGGTQNEHH